MSLIAIDVQIFSQQFSGHCLLGSYDLENYACTDWSAANINEMSRNKLSAFFKPMLSVQSAGRSFHPLDALDQ